MAPAGLADARATAEATFSTSVGKLAVLPALRSREVRNRHGCAVRVELRRASGQLDLPL